LAFIFLMGDRSNCNNQPASLDCSSNLSVTVLRGTCAQFDNNCSDNLWVVGDSWEPDGMLPTGVSLITCPSASPRCPNPPTRTRVLCASNNAEIVTNQPFRFTYERNSLWGEGTLHLSTGLPVTVSVSSNPSPPVLSAGSSVQLLATAAGGVPPYSYQWTPSSGLSNPGVANPAASPAGTTTYTVTVTDSAGFHASTSIEILVGLQVRATATPSVSGPGRASLLAALVEGGIAPYSFSWSPADSLDAPASQTPFASPAVTTTYTVTVRDAAGAQAMAWVTVTVFFEDATATPPQVACGNSSQLLVTVQGGTPPYSYSWSPAVGLSATNIANPIATPQSTTTYGVIVTDATGAIALAGTVGGFVTVNVTGTCGGLVVSIAASVSMPIIINVGDTIGLFATATGGAPPYAYQWAPLTGLSPSTTIPNVNAGPLNTTNYVVNVTDANGATASASILIVVRLVMSANASPTVISPGQSSQLSAFTLGGAPPISFAWTPPGSLDNPASMTPIARPTTTTTYAVVATDANGLQASASVTVQVLLALTVSANPPSIARGSSSTLLATVAGGTPPYTYAWSPATGLSATNVPSPTASPTATTTYTVTVTDALGATISRSVTLTVTP